MWVRALITILLFYFFAILQNSFLPHFNIFGIVPNIIFIFFFLLVFFSARGRPTFGWEEIFYAIVAGFFLDIFSSSYFGASIIILFLTAVLTKKIINSLKDLSIVSFIALFLIFFTIYEIILRSYLFINFSWIICIEIIYNLITALLGFYIFKKIFKSK